MRLRCGREPRFKRRDGKYYVAVFVDRHMLALALDGEVVYKDGNWLI